MGLLTILSSGGSPSPDVGADFWSDCFEAIIPAGASEVVLFVGTDYSLPKDRDGNDLSSEDILVRIQSSRKTGRGVTSGGANQAPDQWSCWLANPASGTHGLDAIRIRRSGTFIETAVTIQIDAVVNPSSTSRFWVRQAKPASLALGDTVHTETDVPAVVDATKVWVCITGQSTNETARGLAHNGKYTANFVGGVAVLTRGISGIQSRLSWAVVEFSSDWVVQRLEFATTSAGGDIWTAGSPNLALTESITGLGGNAVADISRTFLANQFRNAVSGNQGNDDQGEVVELTGTNELTVRKCVAAGEASKTHVVYVIEHVGAGGTAPIAEHISNFVGTGGSEQEIITRTVTAVVSAATTTIMGACASSDGTGNLTPRGNVDFCLTSTTTVDETRSDTQRSERRAYTVWQWPVGSPAALTTATRQTEISSAGSDASAVMLADSARSEVSIAESAASDLRTPGSARSELSLPGSGASDLQPL